MRIETSLAACVAAALALTFITDRAFAIVLAADSASDPAYAFEADGAWKGENPGANENPPGNDNGGFGFLPWDFSGGFHAGGAPYGTLNHFIDGVDFPTTSFNNLGAPAFALGNEPLPFFGITAVASRPFAQELAVGDVFSADIDTPAEYDDFSGTGFPFAIIGFSDAAGEETFNIEAGFSQQYGDFNWRYDDFANENGDFGVDAGGSSIAPTAPSDGSSFSLEILTAPMDGIPATGRFTFDGVSLDINFIAGLPKSVFFLMFDNNAESGGSSVGDYNEDDQVNAADYTFWRDHLGQTFQLPNEGDGVTPGEVTPEDYAAWQANFGATVGPTGEHAFYFDNLKIERPEALGTGSSVVPEPSSLLLLLAGFGVLMSAAMCGRTNGARRQVAVVPATVGQC